MNLWGHRLLLACLVAGWSACCARAQAPAESPLVKHHTAQSGLVIPVRIDDAKRTQLKALQLYVRNGPSQPWVCAESAPPTSKQFTYRVPEDGEYWFNVVAVNQAGQALPRNVERERPELVVVVDTKPPECDLRVLTLSDATLVLQCDIYDANPDVTKTRIDYSSFANSWKPLEPEPRAFGCYRVPDPKVLGGQVRISLTDRAGNATTRTVSLASARPFSVTDSAALVSAAIQRAQPEAATAAAQTTMQHVRAQRVSLAYEVEPSANGDVGKVEVWYSADQGQTWRSGGEDRDRQSPIDFELPGEGRYGVCLVVSNGAGYGGVPPSSGARPDWWIEVDLTPPAVKLLGVRPGNKQEELGTYVVSWSAADKNLGPVPISLSYSSSQDGPWTPIAKGIKNQGEYAWLVPNEVRGLIFIRLEAADLAGNVAHCEMTTGVQVDVVRPKVRVLGVVDPASK